MSVAPSPLVEAQKSPEELYQERLQRALDVAALRIPDRIPVFGPYQQYPYRFAGVTFKEAMNDYAAARRAWHAFADYFQPDLHFGPILAYPARALELLDWKAFKWPGHGLPDDTCYQYLEGEFMSPEEYDEFLYDPSHFMTTKWTPRQMGGLAGLAGFPAMRTWMWSGWMVGLVQMASPEVQAALARAKEIGDEIGAWFGSVGQFAGEMAAKGMPQAWAGWDWPPFDIIGDTLRGTRGVLTDMRRHPDQLLAALEIATKIFVEYGQGAAGAELPWVWIWMHKGTGNFMSDEQFTTFYWPFLRKGMLALIDKGITPVVYCEADVESRLEHFADVPKGKVIYHIAQTNLAKAKEVLGGTAAIMGNVPNLMLAAGTPDEVREYCKRSIDIAGKDGGYIMDCAVMLDEARPENLKAMIDFTKEYGIYR
jgi:Uroporphyrinogen decarboxylase (URO-D)